jgi:flagellar basal-body rod protein FlgB
MVVLVLLGSGERPWMALMDLSRQTLFRIMQDRLGYLGQRQRVLSENVANADTPGYQARDMAPVNFLQALQQQEAQLVPAATQPGHLPPLHPVSAFKIEGEKRPYETKPDKNGVVLEEQMVKLSDTQIAYQTTTSLYKKYTDMIKLVLKS